MRFRRAPQRGGSQPRAAAAARRPERRGGSPWGSSRGQPGSSIRSQETAGARSRPEPGRSGNRGAPQPKGRRSHLPRPAHGSSRRSPHRRHRNGRNPRNGPLTSGYQLETTPPAGTRPGGRHRVRWQQCSPKTPGARTPGEHICLPPPRAGPRTGGPPRRRGPRAAQRRPGASARPSGRTCGEPRGRHQRASPQGQSPGQAHGQPRRPPGRPGRGRTRENDLTRQDATIARAAPDHLDRRSAGPRHLRQQPWGGPRPWRLALQPRLPPPAPKDGG